MTAAQPLTASAFLFDDEDTGRALARALNQHGVLGSLGIDLGPVAQTTRDAAVADGVLALDLGDLVIAGWRKQGQLTAAAERTAATPTPRSWSSWPPIASAPSTIPMSSCSSTTCA